MKLSDNNNLSSLRKSGTFKNSSDNKHLNSRQFGRKQAKLNKKTCYLDNQGAPGHIKRTVQVKTTWQ